MERSGGVSVADLREKHPERKDEEQTQQVRRCRVTPPPHTAICVSASGSFSVMTLRSISCERTVTPNKPPVCVDRLGVIPPQPLGLVNNSEINLLKFL